VRTLDTPPYRLYSWFSYFFMVSSRLAYTLFVMADTRDAAIFEQVMPHAPPTPDRGDHPSVTGSNRGTSSTSASRSGSSSGASRVEGSDNGVLRPGQCPDAKQGVHTKFSAKTLPLSGRQDLKPYALMRRSHTQLARALRSSACTKHHTTTARSPNDQPARQWHGHHTGVVTPTEIPIARRSGPPTAGPRVRNVH